MVKIELNKTFIFCYSCYIILIFTKKRMFKLVAITILLINIPLCKGQCYVSYDLNVDYKGDDLFSQPVFVDSVDSCCLLCSNYTNCLAWTYVPDNKACWLKSSFFLKLLSNGRLSGIKPSINSTTNTTTTSSSTTLNTTVQTPPTTTTKTSTSIPIPTTSTTTLNTTASTSTTITTTIVTPITKQYGCFIEYNINYFGNDLVGSYVTSPSDCCNLCGQTTSCLVWSYTTDTKFCFLKNTLPSFSSRSNYTGILSGIVTLR